MCEQAEHVTSPQEMEYDVTMKTGSSDNTEAEKSTALIHSSCSYFTFGSRHFQFSFRTCTNIKKKSNQ